MLILTILIFQNLLKKYQNKKVLHQQVIFDNSFIQLSIPENGLVLNGDWIIQPLAPPIVSVH